jgi:Holliday junction resolvasome RuvABC endonuclease subunit
VNAAVVGLDLSIAATGVAAVDGTPSTIKAPAKDGDTRLRDIRCAVRRHLVATDVDLFVIEDLPTHAHGAGITGMVHGAVRALLIEANHPYALVTPATLKKFATGKGNAGKPEMAVALYKRTGLELGDDNQVDAAWLRYAGLFHLGCPPFDLPAAQVAALDKVVWPVSAAPADRTGDDR